MGVEERPVGNLIIIGLASIAETEPEKIRLTSGLVMARQNNIF